ncbi:hypothetical protein Tco_1103806 [Tanacetum coccineum]
MSQVQHQISLAPINASLLYVATEGFGLNLQYATHPRFPYGPFAVYPIPWHEVNGSLQRLPHKLPYPCCYQHKHATQWKALETSNLTSFNGDTVASCNSEKHAMKMRDTYAIMLESRCHGNCDEECLSGRSDRRQCSYVIRETRLTVCRVFLLAFAAKVKSLERDQRREMQFLEIIGILECQ